MTDGNVLVEKTIEQLLHHPHPVKPSAELTVPGSMHVQTYVLGRMFSVTLASNACDFITHSASFELFIDKLRHLPVRMLSNVCYADKADDWLRINRFWQQQLHPAMQQTLIAVKTRGDGNCLFYSTWLQLFEGHKNFAVARGMRLIILYKLQKDEARLRRYANVDGANQYDRDVL